MSDADLTQLLNTFNLIAFVVLVVLVFIRLGIRLAQYGRARRWPDVILRRDLAVFGSFTWAFALILTVRALDLADDVAGNPYWPIVTGWPVLAALAYSAWVEYVRIG